MKWLASAVIKIFLEYLKPVLTLGKDAVWRGLVSLTKACTPMVKLSIQRLRQSLSVAAVTAIPFLKASVQAGRHSVTIMRQAIIQVFTMLQEVQRAMLWWARRVFGWSEGGSAVRKIRME